MKFILILFILSTRLFALSPDSLFSNNYSHLEEILSKQGVTPNLKSPTSLVSNQLVLSILQDRDNKVPSNFKIPKYFFNSVRFWFGIYTQYTSDHIVIHDKSNLKLIYDIMDFTDLNKSALNRFIKNQQMNKYSSERVKLFKNTLADLSKGKSNNDPIAKKIINLIKLSGVKISKNSSEARKIFKDLAEGVRTQTGQRDMIYKGLLYSIPYFPFLNNFADEFELPIDLLAIPFLESSFNPYARSKVGASGIWQIMPIIGHKIISKDKNIDGRINPFLASIAAFHLLKQNYRILGRWDLSVTAYNSGTKHLLRAQNILKIKKPTLETIFTKYNHPHLGFASKNFYCEFLALAHVLRYKNILFPLDSVSDPDHLNVNKDRINIYVSKCPLTPANTFSSLKEISPDLEKLNYHLLNTQKTYSRGTIFVSDVHLNQGLFLQLKPDQLRQKFPINWAQYLSNQSCSTK